MSSLHENKPKNTLRKTFKKRKVLAFPPRPLGAVKRCCLKPKRLLPPFISALPSAHAAPCAVFSVCSHLGLTRCHFTT